MAKKIMEMNLFKRSILTLLVLSLTGCGALPGMQMRDPPDRARYEASQFKIEPIFVPITPELLKQMPETKKDYYYYVGPQDVLNITVWDHPEFSEGGGGEATDVAGNTAGVMAASGGGGNTGLNPPNAPGGFLVNPEGNIYFPLIGNVNVQNKTTDEIRTQIANLLTRYVRNPQVDVRVAGFRSHKIYILGEVMASGLLNLTDVPTSLTDAIMLGGGINQDTADPRKIYVIRGDILKPKVYWLNAASPDALILGENFHLENNDIVFVSTADVTRFNRAVNQIMPTVQTYFYAQTTIQQSRLH